MLTKLGPFQILEVIGRGGMGTVYRGIDPMIGRPVAVKVIRLVGYYDNDEQEWLRDRLFREARAAGSLSHPSIVTIYQVGEEQDVAYIAMEFVDGPSLESILAADGPRDKTTLCRILCEAGAALDYAHRRGLVHRDIKPANIMLTASGLTKVTDFGIAKTMLGQTATKTGMILGTPFYMSPEQIRGKTLDGRSDQFALAVIAYEIFTGRKPFEADQLTSVCYQIIHEEPLSPEDVSPGVGGELAAVVKRGLAKDADARYASCSEFAEALQAAALHTPARPRPPKPEPVETPASNPVETVTQFSRAEVARPSKVWIKRAIWAVCAVFVALALAALWALNGTLPKEKLRSELVHAPLTVASDPRPAIPVIPRAGTLSSEAGRAGGQVRAGRAKSKPLGESPAEPEKAEPVEHLKEMPVESRPSTAKAIVVWTGHVPVNGLLTIAGASASLGSLSGTLPRSPGVVEIYPAEVSSAGLTVFNFDPRYIDRTTTTTPRGTATFVFDPRHATDIVTFEYPSAQNNWERLVISIRNPKISACMIEWRSE